MENIKVSYDLVWFKWPLLYINSSFGRFWFIVSNAVNSQDFLSRYLLAANISTLRNSQIRLNLAVSLVGWWPRFDNMESLSPIATAITSNQVIQSISCTTICCHNFDKFLSKDYGMQCELCYFKSKCYIFSLLTE